MSTKSGQAQAIRTTTWIGSGKYCYTGGANRKSQLMGTGVPVLSQVLPCVCRWLKRRAVGCLGLAQDYYRGAVELCVLNLLLTRRR